MHDPENDRPNGRAGKRDLENNGPAGHMKFFFQKNLAFSGTVIWSVIFEVL